MSHIHTPAMSNAVQESIEMDTNLEFEIVSYGNDCTDSIYNQKLNIQIYLPNSVITNTDQELFSHYGVTCGCGYEEELPCFNTKDLDNKLWDYDEVVKYINCLNRWICARDDNHDIQETMKANSIVEEKMSVVNFYRNRALEACEKINDVFDEYIDTEGALKFVQLTTIKDVKDDVSNAVDLVKLELNNINNINGGTK